MQSRPSANKEQAQVQTRALLFFGCALLFSSLILWAQDFRIDSYQIDSEGRLWLRHPADTNSYYILYRAETASAPQRPIALALGHDGPGYLSDPAPAHTNSTAFYRVRCVPLDAPIDCDLDGIDDVYELRHSGFLNPIDPSDADQDSDGDGISNFAEYLRGTDPGAPTAIFTNDVRMDYVCAYYNGYEVIVDGATLTANCELRLRSLTLRNGGVLAHLSDFYRLRLTVTNDLRVDATSRIDVTGRGIGPGSGAGMAGGRHCCTGGGGHGGAGGYGQLTYGGATYGSITEPMDLGSGGGYVAGSTSYGGGAVRLDVHGRFQLDGELLAEGQPGSGDNGGAGSGGSIFVSAGVLAGAGRISANGGSASTGSLGGGGGGGRVALYFGTNAFEGGISARGGTGYLAGGAGTIFTRRQTESLGTLLIDNGHLSGATTEMSRSNNVPGALIIQGGAIVGPRPGETHFHLVVMGDASIEHDGAMSADGRGIGAGSGGGTARGDFCCTGGAGYGGAGGSGTNTAGGAAYGSITEPMDLGSGGGYAGGTESYGGGAIRLSVTGTLRVEGRLTANGWAGSGIHGGAGSGGSLYLSADRIAGRGQISANGGSNPAGSLGGGGGGGRIAIYFGTDEFAGVLTACGGDGAVAGGAGTVLVKGAAQTHGRLIVSNCGRRGATTEFSRQNIVPGDLIVREGGIVGPPAGEGDFHLIVLHDAFVEADGALSADGRGIGPGSGGGMAGGSHCCTGGGGHGGAGGLGTNSYAGGTYGWFAEPMELGSGGGYVPGSTGIGGGAMRVTVNGSLRVDGRISADGFPGSGAHGGAGSGGSLYLTANVLAGTGAISANGGSNPGGWLGGSGGGGRVAIHITTNDFAGEIMAQGGEGSQIGGAGTVWLKVAETGTLVLDNGGQVGAVTEMSRLNVVPGNLRVRGRAILGHRAGEGNFHVVIEGNAVIEPNGAIAVDGRGIGPGSGGGMAGGAHCCTGGGGHGGFGGAGEYSNGGTTYGWLTQPTDLGSGGGYVPESKSFGGGAVRLTVSGQLRVDGRLSADGDAGSGPNGGAGSGGSIYVVAQSLSGAGIISANGGSNPDGWLGGGGGGGRIAILSTLQSVFGRIEATGGAGWQNGRPGTIYLEQVTSPEP